MKSGICINRGTLPQDCVPREIAVAPASSNARGCRPRCLPSAFAFLGPTLTLSRINSLSYSATEAKIFRKSRYCGVGESMWGSVTQTTAIPGPEVLDYRTT